jgi:tetratricopeptide (TPR) repeat protein
MSRWLIPSACALAAALTLAPTTASAQRNPLIERGQQEYDDLRYEEALQTLSAALVRSGNSRNDMATIYRVLAFTYLALGREEEAAGAYRSMLPIVPEYEPGDEVSPRIREFFGQIRQQWEEAGRPGSGPPPPVDIRHRSPPEAGRGEPVELSAQLEDPGHRVADLVLAYRQGTSAVFRRLDTTRVEDGFTATIPGDDVAPPLVEYYFEALDAQGLPVAARGDVAAPLRIAVPAPGGDVTGEWWFWTIIGVAAAGLVAGIVTGVVLADQASGPQTGTLVIIVE